jgi:alkylation response protein AidB-like acyl-CoA dehydrogenase
MSRFEFRTATMPPATMALRTTIRDFLAVELAALPAHQRVRSWGAFDARFSQRLGERGWVGMTWPAQYGGRNRSALERYVVLEELLAAGAPVGAHWIADRQSGPLLLRFGTEEQRRRLLPGMARGEIFFCIGMSEPSAGSDLAGLRTRASKVEGGWEINGSKIWTTNADRAHYMICLLRTSGPSKDRHSGLSQVIVDLKSSGLTARPIEDLTGSAHFSEVFFENVFVPDAMLIGEEGAGWAQVTAELALERSGPERYLSSYYLLEALMRSTLYKDLEVRRTVGKLVATLWTLRQMSASVASQLQDGLNPAQEAAIVKDMGTEFEQEIPQVIRAVIHNDRGYLEDSELMRVIDFLTQASPAFSLRGGTREILRGIVARGLELR